MSISSRPIERERERERERESCIRGIIIDIIDTITDNQQTSRTLFLKNRQKPTWNRHKKGGHPRLDDPHLTKLLEHLPARKAIYYIRCRWALGNPTPHVLTPHGESDVQSKGGVTFLPAPPGFFGDLLRPPSRAPRSRVHPAPPVGTINGPPIRAPPERRAPVGL